MHKHNKKSGFTLIELMMTMTIIGILVALAMPNYLEQNNNAKTGLIQKDVILVESYVGEQKILNPRAIEQLENQPVKEIERARTEGKLYNNDGQVNSITGERFKRISLDIIEDIGAIESEGLFVTNEHGQVYYVHPQ